MAMDRAMDLGRYHCRRTLAARAGALRVGVTSVTALGACVETDAATIEPDTGLSTGAARASVLLTHPQHRQPPANARKSDELLPTSMGECVVPWPRSTRPLRPGTHQPSPGDQARPGRFVTSGGLALDDRRAYPRGLPGLVGRYAERHAEPSNGVRRCEGVP